ncbi:MAG: hypothetical protein GXP41_07845 [Chloroflexi bacterium]|nr:hypothetical protein [Chloroflexota bacterium]
MTVQTISNDEVLSRLTTLEKTVVRLQTRLNMLLPNPRPVDPLAEDEEEYVPLDDPVAEKERTIAWLRRIGAISEPSPYTRAWAAKWEALSEEEKKAFWKEIRSLHLDPPLSQIVLDNRR